MRTLIVLIGTAVLLSPAAPAQESSSPTLEYAHDADTLVIQMKTVGAWVVDSIPRLRIYGDGHVLVHKSRKPGGQHYFEFWLPKEGLQDLLRFLYDHGAMEYEYGIVKKRLKEDDELHR